jgi:hypothetical protein
VTSSTNSSVNKLETARTFVPGWWVHAFETACAMSNQTQGEFDVVANAVLPRFSPQELSTLAVILGDMQRQLLEAEIHEHVDLRWLNVQKHLSGVDAASKERLASVFESLPELRFPVLGPDGEARCFRIFDSETWIKSSTGEGGQVLRLRPSSFAVELLTGYTDAHLDLLRRLTAGPCLAELSRGRFPLVLWTPVWLELSLPEQLVYARMEAAMQDESAWLRLDGLVGVGLEQLTSGIRLSRRSIEQPSTLMERLRIVGKLGRRLVAHGVLKREPDSGYMAIEQVGSKEFPWLLWQPSSDRIKSKAESEYFGLVSAKILKSSVSPQIAPVLASFAALAGIERSRLAKQLESIWSAISMVPGCGFVLGPGVMIQAHVLFCEWVARAFEGALRPLGSGIRDHAIFTTLQGVTAQSAVQKFRDFLSVMRRSDELRVMAKEDGDFSISYGPLGVDIEEICRKGAVECLALSRYAGKNEPRNDRPEDAKVMASAPVTTVKPNLEPQIQAKPSQLAQNLRRLAQDELDKIMRQSPSAYADLKQKYIASLDDETKSLVMDVQRRLGSKTFDRHLRIRLVHYMVEHPSSWNSISTMLPS